MMSLIELQDMEFYAYHGCFAAEKKVGSKFLVNLWLEYDASKASETDNIKDALNYQTAYDIVEAQMQITSSLLEHVAKRIIDALYETFGDILISAQVDVSKVAPPMGGKMKSVTVTLRREKEEESNDSEEDKIEVGIHTNLYSMPTC